MGVNGVSNSDLVDLTRTTLQNLPNMEFEMALQYQQYHVINQWFQKEKVQIESGTSIERNVILDPQGNAVHVRLYQKTPINVADNHQKITAPWVQVQTSWSIERREALRNRKPSMYISLLKSRRLSALVQMANLLELRGWTAPQNASDDLNPRGLPYWISKVTTLTTDTEPDFVGQTIRYADATTATTKAGIDASTAANAKWRNLAGTYGTAATAGAGFLPTANASYLPNDGVRRLRKCFHLAMFQSPILASDLVKGNLSRYKMYMNVTTLSDLEELATIKNENLGPDLGSFHGVTTFRRIPLLYAPVLDTDTHNPLYGINHAKFYPIVLEGDWMREGDPMMDVEQHNVITSFLDGSYQYFADNVREAGFVLTQKQ